MPRRSTMLLLIAAALLQGPVASADPGTTEQVTVLRNTVVNILDALVKQGLLTKATADKLVAEAQAKADAEVAAEQQQAAPEAGDVRVTYVPQVVQDQITENVRKDIQKTVVADVKQAALVEGWGVPAALPSWVRNSRWSGELRVRAESDAYASDNKPNTYFDYQAINVAGGYAQAGNNVFLNTTVNQNRYLLRASFGGEFDLSPSSLAVIRFGTGNQLNPTTRNQVLGNYDRTFPVLLEEAYLRLGGTLDGDQQSLLFWAGRTPNPYQSTELVWDNDVRFNGFSLQYSWDPASDVTGRGLFGTLGAYTIQDVNLSTNDKWLYAGQLGYEFNVAEGVRLSIAGTYYDYQNITGRKNPADSTVYNYTAPQWVQKGNTLFNISSNPANQLFALAADYDIAEVIASATWTLRPDLVMDMVADYVSNVGYSESDVEARTDAVVPGKVTGYRLEFRIGSPDITKSGAWRVFGAYHYAERDSVLDAFTDSDFHLGGTDAEGYILGGEYGITNNTWARLRYMSADQIDGDTLGIDVLQVDLNGKF